MRRFHTRRLGVFLIGLVASLMLLLERPGASAWAQEREERDEERRGDRERDQGESREGRGRRDREGDREGERERDREGRSRRDRGGERERGGRALAHMVFFDLAADSEEAREKLVAACKEHLSGHRGTLHFSVGVIAEELDREVNDRDFDVALHLIFRNKAAHDRYQEHPRHLEFIEKNKDLWKGVRVFDSYLSPRRDRESERPRRLSLPDAASGFSGQVRGRVLRVGDGGRVLLRVSEVVRQWDQSRASDAKSLEGQRVLVVPRREEGGRSVRRFLESLRPEEEVTLDVAHRRGGTLVVLELTEEQRERAGRVRRERDRGDDRRERERDEGRERERDEDPGERERDEEGRERDGEG